MTFSLLEQVVCPDLLRFNAGEKVLLARQWPLRRAEVRRHVVALAYGDLPASAFPYGCSPIAHGSG